MERLILKRVYLFDAKGVATETLGSIYWGNDMICKTMELPWRRNASSKNYKLASCVPENIYIIHKQHPEPRRNYGYFRFEHVPNRNLDKKTGWSRILIHRISYVSGLLGCVGVGGRFTDLNKDGILDIANSTKKLEWMYQNLPDTFELEIKRK